MNTYLQNRYYRKLLDKTVRLLWLVVDKTMYCKYKVVLVCIGTRFVSHDSLITTHILNMYTCGTLYPKLDKATIDK